MKTPIFDFVFHTFNKEVEMEIIGSDRQMMPASSARLGIRLYVSTPIGPTVSQDPNGLPLQIGQIGHANSIRISVDHKSNRSVFSFMLVE